MTVDERIKELAAIHLPVHLHLRDACAAAIRAALADQTIRQSIAAPTAAPQDRVTPSEHSTDSNESTPVAAAATLTEEEIYRTLHISDVCALARDGLRLRRMIAQGPVATVYEEGPRLINIVPEYVMQDGTKLYALPEDK